MGGLAGGQQLTAGALGERLCSEAFEEVVGCAELPAGVHATVLPAQPLAVHELGSGQVQRDTAP